MTSIIQQYQAIDNKTRQRINAPDVIEALNNLSTKYPLVNIGLVFIQAISEKQTQSKIEQSLILMGLNKSEAGELARAIWQLIIQKTSFSETEKVGDNNNKSINVSHSQSDSNSVTVNNNDQSEINHNKSKVVSRLWLSDITNQVKLWQEKRLNVNSIVAQLYQSALQKNTVLGLASLRLLAESGKLSVILSGKNLSQLLVSQYRKINDKDAESDFMRNPSELKHLSNMLNFLLTKRFGLSEEDGAHVASNLIGLSREKGEQLEHIAYIDDSDGKYHWI